MARRAAGLATAAWTVLIVAAVGASVVVAPLRNYDVEAGLRALTVHPVPVVVSHLLFAWVGVALVFLVVNFHDAPPAPVPRVRLQVATAFGILAAGFFVIVGLVGGLAVAELLYIQSVHSSTCATPTCR